MAILSSIGQPTAHVEGPAKVTGQAKYSADITLPGMLWGKCLRSPFPHARVGSIDTANAKKVPGVCAVVTGADLPEVLIGRFLVGTVINPLTHQGQIEGGVVQGIGQALTENLVVRDGAVITAHLGDYKLPTAMDIPELTTVFVENQAGPAPHGGKAIGEVSNVAVPGGNRQRGL
jgi:CO/xanthine dehydrogenase Mo-binding subunit